MFVNHDTLQRAVICYTRVVMDHGDELTGKSRIH